MKYNNRFVSKSKMFMQQTESIERYLNIDDIGVPIDYKVEIFAMGIDTPIGIVFTETGDMLIADSGILSGNPKVILLRDEQYEIIADGFNVPITGINYRYDEIYVSHRGTITIIKSDGTKQDIIMGLPSFGDYCNNKVTFGSDEKMYFGQGTATNSGVVGLDNEWVYKYSFFHDFPGSYIMLNGYNYETKNMLIPAEDIAITGAFSPFAGPNFQRFEIVKGAIQASGSVLKANPDGSELELVAWGFRNPFAVKFDNYNRLFVANQGYEERGSRPITNAPDELQLIIPGTWYGWPDYAGGELVNLPKFTPSTGEQPQLLFTNNPSIPPKPYTTFPSCSHIMGFDFNYNPSFGPEGDIYIAEFGSTRDDILEVNIISGVGHRVNKVDGITGENVTFAMNKSGIPAYITPEGTQQGGGFSRPSDVVFGPDGAMYVCDLAIFNKEYPYDLYPNTGVIWRISIK